jgi:hypothetical protein
LNCNGVRLHEFVELRIQHAKCERRCFSRPVCANLIHDLEHQAGFSARLCLGENGKDSRRTVGLIWTPHLNGKVERSDRVDEQEFCQLLDKGGIADDIHLFNEKLREWEDYYNYHRPHGALDGQTPYERLLAKTTASLFDYMEVFYNRQRRHPSIHYEAPLAFEHQQSPN